MPVDVASISADMMDALNWRGILFCRGSITCDELMEISETVAVFHCGTCRWFVMCVPPDQSHVN